MKAFAIHSFAIPIALAGLIMLPATTAWADSIVDAASNLSDFIDHGEISWSVPCDFELGASAINDDDCGGNFEIFSSSFTTTVNYATGVAGGVTLSGVAGTVFGFQEVDTWDQSRQLPLAQVDSVVADPVCNPNCTGPLTLSFDSSNVTGLATTIYSEGPFAATVTAYDRGGSILGSTSYNSAETNGLLYFSDVVPTYYALVGLQDLTAPDIASVVIETTPTAPGGVAGDFGIGNVGVLPAPEPSSLLLIGASLVAVAARRRAGL